MQSRIKLLDKLDLVELEDEEATVNFNFPPATHSGKISLEISHLTKSYDGLENVLENIDLIISRGEKIAFVGVNGAGKSTFMRIIAGIEKYQGEVKLGHLAEIKFYAQNQAEELDASKTVLQTMEEAARGDILKNLRSILGSFLFRGDDVFKKVGVLSGGEKSRLALAKMLIEPSNFLIFDEPTNHLDMKSKEVLMNALQKYEGTVVIVSHDREFIDGIVDKVIEVKNKKIRTYFGNATDYLKAKEDEQKKAGAELRRKTDTEKKNEPEKTISGSDVKIPKKKNKEVNKTIIPIKNRINELEKNAQDFEAKIKEKESIMSKDEFYKGGYNVVEFTNEYNSLKEKLKNVYLLWEKETDKLNSLSQQ